ncbi:hypothetical protein HMPREF3226_00703 [Prevotella corporis]|uniref:Uncharacterized protein n=1 Tax=Prevotella corporis TaxID=28128 RepID=A0A133QHI2_9BACT|nr:hypothetical protein HMPREF3226_00703 [Prevotella corporis]
MQKQQYKRVESAICTTYFSGLQISQVRFLVKKVDKTHVADSHFFITFPPVYEAKGVFFCIFAATMAQMSLNSEKP